MLNGSRLGFYDPIRQATNKLLGHAGATQIFAVNVFAGASSGVIGAILGNPLYLVKARMQAYSPFNPVGAQHNYRSPVHALSTVVKAEGIKGLARGVDAAMLRTAMGSSAQLPAYNFAKGQLISRGILPEKSVWTYLLSSTFSGICVCAVMQPADTALTRMYNQSPNSIGPDGKPRGLLCAFVCSFQSHT
jgi:solute carrier family 25 protein 34/35